MRIAIDAMGGDYGPEVVIPGAFSGARKHGVGLILVGRPEKIRPIIAKTDTSGVAYDVIDASEDIEMDDAPALAVRRKRGASMNLAMLEVKEGRAAGMLSAGNSGAVMASALMHFGRISGIDRPALCSEFPTRTGSCILLDLGAVVDPKPQNLVEFALMAKVYAERYADRKNPTIALLSNGEEPSKGNALVLETHPLLAAMPELNFIGNIEGKDILDGKADIIVTDGFSGNIALKSMEGTASALISILREEVTKGPIRKLGALLLKPAFRSMAGRLDYQRFGGAPLLGVNGVAIVSHGRSSERAIASAVRVAARTAELDLVGGIAEAIRS